MEESWPSKNPAGEKTLGSDKAGDTLDQEW